MIRSKPSLPILLRLLLLVWLPLGCSQAQPAAPEPVGENMPMESDQSQIQIIAHRGARSLAPENTLAAAIKALEVGADGWELDVTMSADGELVLLHDDTLQRTSNAAEVFPERAPWTVYEFSLEELKQLDFGSWFVESDPFKQAALGNLTEAELNSYAGLPITTLSEALQFTKDNDWWVNVEIKDASGTEADSLIVAKVVALIEEMGMQEQVLVSSFNHSYLSQVKSINPSIATGVLIGSAVMDPLGLVEELEGQALHPGRRTVLPNQIRSVMEAGYAVNVWTVNEEAEMKQFIEMGVSGIITDYPQTLKALLEP
jgi:glycerophosphoryl diester phosphodiesterase